jgi:hypothetical protein
MPIEQLYRHTITVKRRSPSGGVDPDGHPITTEVTVATVRGRLAPAPRSTVGAPAEAPATHQAAPVAGRWRAYLAPLAGFGTDCWLEIDGARYDVLEIADAGGAGHHLEVTCRRVEVP